MALWITDVAENLVFKKSNSQTQVLACIPMRRPDERNAADASLILLCLDPQQVTTPAGYSHATSTYLLNDCEIIAF